MHVKFVLPGYIYDQLAIYGQLADDSLLRQACDRLDDCSHEPTRRPSIVFGKRFEMCRRCGKILDA
jgi:hypothetical protein